MYQGYFIAAWLSAINTLEITNDTFHIANQSAVVSDYPIQDTQSDLLYLILSVPIIIAFIIFKIRMDLQSRARDRQNTSTVL